MSTQVTIQTADGRIINAISYSVSSGSVIADPVTLAASVPGGMDYGVYHLRHTNGWVYTPANQIQQIIRINPGVPT